MDKLTERLEQIKQKTAADAAESEQLKQRVAALAEEIDNTDAEIELATFAEDVPKIEKLLAKRSEKEMRRAALARVMEQKNRPLRYFDEVKAVAAEYAAANQSKVDKAIAEIEKANRACLEKRVALARILKEQADFRKDCAIAAGFMATDYNMANIASVKYKADALEVNQGEDLDFVVSLEPDFINIVQTVQYMVACY